MNSYTTVIPGVRGIFGVTLTLGTTLLILAFTHVSTQVGRSPHEERLIYKNQPVLEGCRHTGMAIRLQNPESGECNHENHGPVKVKMCLKPSVILPERKRIHLLKRNLVSAVKPEFQRLIKLNVLIQILLVSLTISDPSEVDVFGMCNYNFLLFKNGFGSVCI